jgi:hypothetical protein
MEERRGANRVLVRKSVGRRPLGRRMRRWSDNIERVFKKLDGAS